MGEADERVRKLEDEVTNLRVSNAQLSVAVEHLAAAVASLTTTVQVLRDTLNQGRGALWLAMILGGSVGAFLMLVLRKILH